VKVVAGLVDQRNRLLGSLDDIGYREVTRQ
jgi:hypothetical protein